MPQFAPPNPARAKQAKPVVLPHGTAHKTAASSQMIRTALGGLRSVLGGRKKKMSSGVRSTTRRRRTTQTRRSSGAGSPKRRVRSAGRGSAHLVKGSAAAKRRMAQLRKMKK